MADGPQNARRILLLGTFCSLSMRLAKERAELRVVDDHIGSPTYCRAIAETTAHIPAQDRGDPAGFLEKTGGLYHLFAVGETNWHGFARVVTDFSADRYSFELKELSPIPTSEYPTLAARPANSLLSCAHLERTFRLEMVPWEAQLRLCLDAGGDPAT